MKQEAPPSIRRGSSQDAESRNRAPRLFFGSIFIPPATKTGISATFGRMKMGIFVIFGVLNLGIFAIFGVLNLGIFEKDDFFSLKSIGLIFVKSPLAACKLQGVTAS